MKAKNYISIFLFELLFYIFDTNTVLQSFIPPSVLEADNIIHLLMQFIEYGIMFFLCFEMTGFKFEKRNFVKSVIIVLPAKIISDITVYYFTIRSEQLSAEPLFNKFIWDIFHILHIIIIFAALFAIWKPQKCPYKRKIAVNVILSTMGTACFIVSGMLLSDFINNTAYKYSIERILSNVYVFDVLPDMQTNFEYYINGASEIYGIISVFIRTLIYASVSNIFSAIYDIEKQGGKNHFKADIFLIVLCYGFNLCFNNVNVFSGIYHGKAVFEKEPSVMTVDYDVWQLLRGIGKERHIQCACDVNYVYIGDEYVCKFRTDPLASSDWLVDYGDADGASIVCETTFIAYRDESSKWEKVKFGELDKAAENEKLTEVLINICKTGNLEAINYALPYLDKYEPELVIEISADSRKANYILSDEYFYELYENAAHKVICL